MSDRGPSEVGEGQAGTRYCRNGSRGCEIVGRHDQCIYAPMSENPIQRAPKPEMLEKADEPSKGEEIYRTWLTPSDSRRLPDMIDEAISEATDKALVEVSSLRASLSENDFHLQELAGLLKAARAEVESLRKVAREAIEGRMSDREELAAARAEATKAERERCARIAEEHTEHIDFDTFSARDEPGGKVQSHHEAPFICNVAQAIRAEVMPDGCTCGATWPCPLHGGPPEPPSSPTPPTSPEPLPDAREVIPKLKADIARSLGRHTRDPEPTPLSEEPRPRCGRCELQKIGLPTPGYPHAIGCVNTVPSPEPPREEPR